MGSVAGATVARIDRPKDSASALLNWACLILSSCVTSYLDSAERPLEATLSISAFVAFTPSARVEAIISVCWAEKSLVAFSTIALI